VRVGDDVAVGIDDHARREAPPFPDDEIGLVVVVVDRTVSSDQHLDDAGRHASDQRRDRGAELVQRIGRC
jgi:hypothetical protein